MMQTLIGSKDTPFIEWLYGTWIFGPDRCRGFFYAARLTLSIVHRAFDELRSRFSIPHPGRYNGIFARLIARSIFET